MEGDDRGDYDAIYAIDEESAAEKFAEDWDCDDCDYTIASGSPQTVYVAQVGSEVVKMFDVSGEFNPSYSAIALDEPDPAETEGE